LILFSFPMADASELHFIPGKERRTFSTF